MAPSVGCHQQRVPGKLFTARQREAGSPTKRGRPLDVPVRGFHRVTVRWARPITSPSPGIDSMMSAPHARPVSVMEGNPDASFTVARAPHRARMTPCDRHLWPSEPYRPLCR